MLSLINVITKFGFYTAKPETELPPFNTTAARDAISKNAYVAGSLYYKYGGNAQVNHMPGIAKAVERLLYIDSGMCGTLGGHAKTPDGGFICEYWDGEASSFDVNRSFENDRKIAFYFDKKQNLSAAVLEKVGTIVSNDVYKIRVSTNQVDRHSLSPLVYALVAYMVHGDMHDDATETVRAHYENLLECWNDVLANFGTVELTNELNVNMRVLENDIYAILKFETPAGMTAFDVSKYSNDVLDLLNEEVEISPDTLIGTLLTEKKKASSNRKKKASQTAVKTVADYADSGEFILDPLRVLTAEESALVPDMGAMVPDEDVLIKAKLIKKSTLSPKPFRNVLWIGETGTGKTTDARILAQLMHLPYSFITINPDTLVSDLYVNVLPNSKKNTVGIGAKELSIIEDAVFNPEDAYKALTGMSKANVTAADVIAKVIANAANNGGDFMYVESALVKAFRYGWVCELQEVNYAMKPGVLGGINAALDDIGVIELPTGEIIHRHPDTIIVMTANDGYEGTRKINQAVKSRMTLKGHLNLPDDDTLARRAAQNSGFKDLKTIKKMVSVMHSIRKVLNENGETNGSCSVRELQSWAQATDILGDPYEAAMATIVPSASDDPEVIQEVLRSLETQFAPRV